MAVHIIAKVCLAVFLDGRLCSYHSVHVVTDFCNPSEEVAPSRILYVMFTQDNRILEGPAYDFRQSQCKASLLQHTSRHLACLPLLS